MVLNEAIKDGGVPQGYAEIIVEFFQFKVEGDKLEGRLVNKTTTQVQGSKLGKYVLISQGKKVAFLGSVQLDEKMANVALGSEVWIQFTHKEKTGEKGFELKNFKVFVKTAQQ